MHIHDTKITRPKIRSYPSVPQTQTQIYLYLPHVICCPFQQTEVIKLHPDWNHFLRNCWPHSHGNDGWGQFCRNCMQNKESCTAFRISIRGTGYHVELNSGIPSFYFEFWYKAYVAFISYSLFIIKKCAYRLLLAKCREYWS